MTLKANRIERYYDSHQREDEELSQTIFHDIAIRYLIAMLEWLFNTQKIGIITNVNLYVTPREDEQGISPDVAVIEGLESYERTSDEPGSYYVGEDGPPPRVVFEMSSKDTWRIDLGIDNKLSVEEQKPHRYAQMGVAEYFAFDPHQPGHWTKELRRKGRLRGWRLNGAGEYEELTKDLAGRLWSEQLNSWLIVDDKFLRLYDEHNNLRLTGEDAKDQLLQAEQQRVRMERERAEIAEQQVEVERRQAETERRRLEELLEKIRKAGLDPDKL